MNDVVQALGELDLNVSGCLERDQRFCLLFDPSTDEDKLEKFAKSLLSEGSSSLSFDKHLTRHLHGKWQWEGQISFRSKDKESVLGLILEACKALGNNDDGYLSCHLEYIICHDQPCSAVLSPMAYDAMKLALGAPPQKRREITKALCEAPRTSVDRDIQRRLLDVLDGKRVRPPLCSICGSYPDYLELHGRL